MQPKRRLNRSMTSGRKRFHKRVKSPCVISIDLGGTKISGAIVDAKFNFVLQETIPSRDSIVGIADPALGRTKALITKLCQAAASQNLQVVRGAAGFPEYVNLEGLLTTADNIDWLEQPQLDFAKLTGFPWLAQSDVRCAGIAEARFGVGRNLADFLYVTVSSGISHTHFLNGQAVTGLAGEAIGFGLIDLIIEGENIPLENYCSGLGIARRYARATQDFSLDAKSLLTLFETDPIAREIIQSAAYVLGDELAKFVYEMQTPVIVIGGGLWLGSDKYRELTIAALKNSTQKLQVEVSIQSAQVENSGVLGAAVYAFADLD